jgi:hypothetical protein
MVTTLADGVDMEWRGENEREIFPSDYVLPEQMVNSDTIY